MKSVQTVSVSQKISATPTIGHAIQLETRKTNVVRLIHVNTDVKVKNEKRGVIQDQCVSLKMKLLENVYTEIS